MMRGHTLTGIFALAFILTSGPALEAGELRQGFFPTPGEQGIEAEAIERAQAAFNPNGFSSFGKYTWDSKPCSPYDLSIGRCVGLYKDDRLSIYPVKDIMPNGDYGHALIHGRAIFTKGDVEFGERNKWIGSTKYGEKYSFADGYLFLPRSSFPPHVLFSKECRSIRMKLMNETTEIVKKVLDGSVETGEIIVEYPLGYDRWYSRNPYLIQSSCFVRSRAYKDKYQPYLGPLKK